MGRFLSWVLALAVIAVIGWWAWTHYGPAADHYAPPGKVDAELDAQPTPEVPPQPAPTPAKATAADGLPSAPIPYDKLNRGEANTAPPEKKSDAKAVFY
jgi:hypothetical protein